MERTAVYQAFAADGRLLYVGLSRNWGRRWAQHSDHSDFYPEVARLEVRWCDDRRTAFRVERHLIETGRPLMNRQYGEPREPDLVGEWRCLGRCRSVYADFREAGWTWGFRPGDRCPDLSWSPNLDEPCGGTLVRVA